MRLIDYLLILISAITSALSAFSIKKFSKENKYFWLIISIVTANILLYFYYNIFKKGNNTASLYVTIKLLSIVLMVLWSFLFLNESISRKEMVGLVLSLIAIFLLSG